EQHRHHEQAALEQVLAHRVDDVRDQFGAVVDSLDLYARGQCRLQFVEPALEPPGYVMAVLADQHEAKTEHRLAASVRRHGAKADGMTDTYVRQIADADRHAVLGRDGDVAKLLDAAGAGDAVDEVHLAGPLDVPAADVAVAVLQRP